MSITQGIIPNGKQQFVNSNGQPLAGGFVYYYIPSTTTFKNTYQDDQGTTLNTNPIVLDGNGQCQAYGDGSYRQQVKDVNGNLIWDVQVDAPLNLGDIESVYSAANGSSLIGFEQGNSSGYFTNAATRNVQVKLNEFVSVKDFGATGNGTTDDTTAISNAVASGANLYFPTGTYLISSPITLSTNGQMFIGTGGILKRASGSMEASSIFNATNINNLLFQNLNFVVASGTAHGQNGGFIYLSGCNNVRVFDNVFNGQIPGLSTQTESIFSAVNTPNCNQLLIRGNQFLYIFGNCCGANNANGSGVYGANVSIVNNLFYNSVDTGIGNWTGAQDISIIGNIFYRNDYSTAYNGVMIDVAGASNVTIVGNVFTGNSIGVRVLTNLGYPDQQINICNNVFQAQYASSTEPATGIKLADYGTTTPSSTEFSLNILGNSFNVVTWGINFASTTTSSGSNSIYQVANNVFNIAASSTTALAFNGIAYQGTNEFVPSRNTFIGSGGLAVLGTIPAISLLGGTETLAFQKNNFTFSGTSNQIFGYFQGGPGLYAIQASLGTCTDNSGIGGYLLVNTLSGTNIFSNVIQASQSNSVVTYLFEINSSGTYEVLFNPHPAGNTDVYYYLNVLRVA